MDLFEHQVETSHETQVPLADHLRPKTIDEIVGQSDQIGEGATLRELIRKGQIPSMIIWGPPGCGKTTFARALSKQTDAQFISANAIDTGAKKLKEIGEDALKRRKYHNAKTILFVDEIHRLNKAQQDVLLPFVESGGFTLIGATTENPSFELNNAVLSRCRLVIFKGLGKESLSEIARNAFSKLELRLEETLTAEALDDLVTFADGDARKLLNAIESITQLEGIELPLDSDSLAKVIGGKSFNFAKKGDERSHIVSAFIKSIRGSDADAGVYYLARLLKAGEDINFIARRLVILASEDVGNADPQGLVVATNAQQACHMVGMPEAGIILAQAVTYLATAPKSNRSYDAYNKAMAEVEKSGSLDVPNSIKNAPTQLMKNLGFGADYKYAHDSKTGHREMDFLPDQLRGRKFYVPTNRGHELRIQKYFEWLKENKD